MLVKLRGCQCFARFGKSNSRKPAVAFCSAASDFTSEVLFWFLDVFSGVGVCACLFLGAPASRRPVGSRKPELLAGETPALPGFAGRVSGAVAQPWMMSWIFSGRFLATSATMSPRRSLTIELRCGAPSISMSTPSVAAMSMIVPAGLSLTA